MRITAVGPTGKVPAGEYRQQTYRPVAAPGQPANYAGVGSGFQTMVWSTGSFVIDKVTVGGVRQYANQRGDFATSAMGGALTVDKTKSAEIVVTGRNLAQHSQGVRLPHSEIDAAVSRSLREVYFSGKKSATNGALAAALLSVDTAQHSYHAATTPLPAQVTRSAVVEAYIADYGSNLIGLAGGGASLNGMYAAAKVLQRAGALHIDKLSKIVQAADIDQAIKYSELKSGAARGLLQGGKFVGDIALGAGLIADSAPGAFEGYHNSKRGDATSRIVYAGFGAVKGFDNFLVGVGAATILTVGATGLGVVAAPPLIVAGGVILLSTGVSLVYERYQFRFGTLNSVVDGHVNSDAAASFVDDSIHSYASELKKKLLDAKLK